MRHCGRLVERVHVPTDLYIALAEEAERRGERIGKVAGDLIAEVLPAALAEVAGELLAEPDFPTTWEQAPKPGGSKATMAESAVPELVAS